MFKRRELIKRELFYLRKCLFEYKNFWEYIYYKYIFSKKILAGGKILEKPVNNPDLSVHVLTCHWDFKMFFWSLASYYQAFKTIGQLYIHNDGTLNTQEVSLIKKKFPSAIVLDARTFANVFADQLNHYPVFKNIRARHFNFFSFKKIIDPYLASDKKMCLIFDTDILWFKMPVELEQAINNGCQDSYMQKNNPHHFLKNGDEIDKQITGFNAGIILYARHNFDTEKLTAFFTKLNENNRQELHFADQVGHVKCLKKLKALPENKYVIRPPMDENILVKHYTAPRRPLFYLEGIKILKDKIL